IYRAVDAIDGVRKSFVGSGVRYDLAMHLSGNDIIDKTNRKYCEELVSHHVSGRLKVAPEHTVPHVLSLMRKPDFSQYYEFKRIFDAVNTKNGLRQQLIPYFISSHPGCREVDMAELAAQAKNLDMHLEQIQDFTPTPMTLATEIYYSGIHPYTGETVFCATDPKEKQAQRQYFFWRDPEHRAAIMRSLERLGRKDLIRKLYSGTNMQNFSGSVKSSKKAIKRR
ncbi:MAG: DUF3362 domain-containing protein, partial [Muribaculum sp.]|nr:DUF3362 domain-containing protein [Muribaculum sp.]